MKRICLWSGPRNISTALMYSFAQRYDTTVVDEPLYGHYLSKTFAKNYHPGADEILETMETDGKKVVDMMLGDFPTDVVFFKQMTHHLVRLDWEFLRQTTNVILTRDPREMLPSFVNQIKKPTLKDTGYEKHFELINWLDVNDLPFVVLDGKNVLLNPRKVLTELCEQLRIPFMESMLSWEPGALAEDGCWAKHWYHNVHKSSEFGKYKPKDGEFPEELYPLLEECMPYYEELSAMAIQP